MKNERLLLFLTIIIFTCRPLLAQQQNNPQTGTQVEGHYVIEQRYVQQLVWIGDEFTRRYEIIIERNEGKAYSAFLRDFAEKPPFQISLPPGVYRYRVIPYDYLDQSGVPSKWVTLEIKPAPIVSVEVRTDNDGNYSLRPFDEDEKIIPGVNEIVIKNPDDLEIEKEVLVVSRKAEFAPSRNFSFYISAAWSPLIPMHGTMKEVFGNDFYAAGASLRFGAFYEKPNWWFVPGLELSAAWNKFNIVEGSHEIAVQAGTMSVNLVAQKQFLKRMAANVKAGFALGLQVGEVSAAQYKYSTGGISPHINIEASFNLFAWKQVYAEAGINYSIFLNQNDGYGFLRPWFGAGWKF